MPGLGHTGGVFGAIHAQLVGLTIDWNGLDPSAYPPPLVARARAAWAHRVETEFRSIQIMTRFLGEVLAAGDPLEVYAGAAAAITDEIRHTALCVGMVEALGGVPALPEPLVANEPAEFLAMGMPERALATAVSMLAVAEAVSTTLIADLHDRCRHPTVRAVLAATLADEDTHRDYGWAYVRASLGRFDAAGRELALTAAEVTLEPLVGRARAILGDVPPARRRLDAWPEPELAELGLLGRERESLLFERAVAEIVRPRLAAL
jgi:hypothetical protein